MSLLKLVFFYKEKIHCLGCLTDPHSWVNDTGPDQFRVDSYKNVFISETIF
jgi:hypothetical protein